MTLVEMIKYKDDGIVAFSDGRSLSNDLESRRYFQKIKNVSQTGVIGIAGIGNFGIEYFDIIDKSSIKELNGIDFIYGAAECVKELYTRHVGDKKEDDEKFEVGTLVGTVSKEKAYIAEISPSGQVYLISEQGEDRAACIGSGSDYAKLEIRSFIRNYLKKSEYPPYVSFEMPQEHAILLGIICLEKAANLTLSVGLPYYAAVISPTNFEWLSLEEINNYREHAQKYLDEQEKCRTRFISKLKRGKIL